MTKGPLEGALWGYFRVCIGFLGVAWKGDLEGALQLPIMYGFLQRFMGLGPRGFASDGALPKYRCSAF